MVNLQGGQGSKVSTQQVSESNSTCSDFERLFHMQPGPDTPRSLCRTLHCSPFEGLDFGTGAIQK